MTDYCHLVTKDLIEALGQLPAETVIGEGKEPVRVGDIASLCMFDLPDGGRVPLRYVKVTNAGSRGFLVDILRPFGERNEWVGFGVSMSSPAWPLLSELANRPAATQSDWREVETSYFRTAAGHFSPKDGQSRVVPHVTLRRFALGNTYEGCLEGDPVWFSESILESVRRQAGDLLGGWGGPMVVVPPPYVPLPDFLCVGHFDRSEDSNPDGPMVSSELCVAWFVEALDKPLDEIIQAAVAQVDWEQHARRYEWEY